MVLCARLANLPPNESSSRVAMFARLRRRCRLHETIGAELGGIFSAYGAGAKQGINAHDKFNLVKATLELKH